MRVSSSRTEVQLDYANVLRLGDNSQATIASLTRTQMQIQLGQGRFGGIPRPHDRQAVE